MIELSSSFSFRFAFKLYRQWFVCFFAGVCVVAALLHIEHDWLIGSVIVFVVSVMIGVFPIMFFREILFYFLLRNKKVKVDLQKDCILIQSESKNDRIKKTVAIVPYNAIESIYYFKRLENVIFIGFLFDETCVDADDELLQYHKKKTGYDLVLGYPFFTVRSLGELVKILESLPIENRRFKINDKLNSFDYITNPPKAEYNAIAFLALAVVLAYIAFSAG